MQTVDISQRWPDFGLPKQIVDVLANCKSLHFPRSRDEVLSLAMGGQTDGSFEVAYDVPGVGRTVEATVARCSNGLAVNYNIRHYGTDPHLEELTVHPSEPLIFLNVRGVPDATCFIWEHTEDGPGVPCPNPRVILPRRFVPNVVNETVEVMIRNLGVRTPPCTADHPTYGIMAICTFCPRHSHGYGGWWPREAMRIRVSRVRQV